MEGHELVHWMGLAFNLDTLKMTWLAMAVLIVFALVATRGMKLVPGTWQNILESAMEWLFGQIENNIGPKGMTLAPIIVTLFLFLFVSNMLGLIPHLSSPTNDLNTTLGLALFVILLVYVMGIKNKGLWGHFSHFFKPNPLFFPINMVDEIAKPVTLSFRLFGNILAGEILLWVLGKLVPWVVPTLWLGFSVFVGIIQAFIFTTLTMAYLANAFADDHH